MEGTPLQEMAAVEVNIYTHEIVDVFHGYANTEQADTFARQHIHGLNKAYVKEHGFSSEERLVAVFKNWIAQKPIIAYYANAPLKEIKTLGLNILDLKLAPWAERKNRASHQLAIGYNQTRRL